MYLGSGGGGNELRSPLAILGRLAGKPLSPLRRATVVTARLEPTSPFGRQFSSSTPLFACVCVWFYLATLSGFFAPALFILLRLVASVCGERCQNVAKPVGPNGFLNEKTATSERWGWPSPRSAARSHVRCCRLSQRSPRPRQEDSCQVSTSGLSALSWDHFN